MNSKNNCHSKLVQSHSARSAVSVHLYKCRVSCIRTRENKQAYVCHVTCIYVVIKRILHKLRVLTVRKKRSAIVIKLHRKNCHWILIVEIKKTRRSYGTSMSVPCQNCHTRRILCSKPCFVSRSTSLVYIQGVSQ